MELQKQQIDYIKTIFQQIKDKNDLLALLNYAKDIIYGEKAYHFELRQLSYYSNPNINKHRYETFLVKKKSGGNRIIHSPVPGLKQLQRSLNLILECVFKPHVSAMGFVKGKSIVDNARLHTGNYYVFNIDLKDFFFSIDQARVWKCLQNKPFNLATNFKKEETGIDTYEVVNIISALCCTNIEVEKDDLEGNKIKVSKNVVPQGAPTSPILTNVVCQRLDYILAGVAKRFGLKYSRYADDITFSSLHNVYQPEGEFLTELNRVIFDQGFVINTTKTRLQKQGARQQVTGLLVNEYANVQKRYIKKIRSWLYLWEEYGYDKAYGFFLNDYINDKAHVKENVPNMNKIIQGKLNFLGMVKGIHNQSYKKLHQRFSNLIHDQLEITKLINSWEVNGLKDMLANNVNLKSYDEFYRFVTNILNNKLYPEDQKTKINQLIIKELNSTPYFFSDLKKEVPFQNQNSIKKNNTVTEYSNPKNVADFMSLFDDPKGLKYLTHDFDESDQVFHIDEFLKLANDVFSQNTRNRSIPKSLWAIVNEFAFSKTPSWNKGCTDGWSTEERILWSRKEKKHLKRNTSFSKTIESFRKLTRIEAPELKYILTNIIEEKLGDRYSDFKIRLIDCEKADFYTHVNYFKEAVKLILDGCYKRVSVSDEISVIYERSYDEKYRKRIIKITHVNSFPVKPLEEFLLDLQKGKGELADVQNKLQGYCDWSVESIFDGVPITVNILNEFQEIKTNHLIDAPIGFSHILTFYQK